MQENLLQQLREELNRRLGAIKSEESEMDMIPTSSACRGDKLSIIYGVANSYEKYILMMEKEEVLDVCDEMLQDGSYSLQTIALSWLNSQKHLLDQSDFDFIESWAKTAMDRKVSCDDFALSVVGEFLTKNPMFIPDVLRWSESDKWQVRRVAAVTMIYCIRRRLYFRETFVTANHLRNDSQDEVKESFRWLLREAMKICPKSVGNYLRIHQKEIPDFFLAEMLEESTQSVFYSPN